MSEQMDEQVSREMGPQDAGDAGGADRLSSASLAALAERWMALFANRTRPYAVQQQDGSYRWVYEDLTLQLVVAHLVGELTLALSSTDAHGRARWACLDVDVPGSLPQLLELRAALAELGELRLTGLVEASRRGGHLWLLLDEPAPAVALRHAIAEALAQLAAGGVEIPAHELYPDASATASPARRLGHAVRLPLGVHRKTARRYPLFDEQGLPCAFTTPERAAAFVMGVPRVAAGPLRERWQGYVAACKAVKAAKGGRTGAKEARARRRRPEEHVEAVEAVEGAERVGERVEERVEEGGSGEGREGGGGTEETGEAGETGETGGDRNGVRVGTRSAVIRWVDAQVPIVDLLAELAPESELRRVGRGYIGWCPFHDDRAPDELTGERGTPSFYVVQDRRYGWSWRCLSTNCAQSTGLMRHSFRLLQDLLGVSVAVAIREAASRWPEAAEPGEAGEASWIGGAGEVMGGRCGGG